MTAQFTEEDESKPVVDINDARAGTVVRVDDGIAYVNFKAGLWRLDIEEHLLTLLDRNVAPSTYRPIH